MKSDLINSVRAKIQSKDVKCAIFEYFDSHLDEDERELITPVCLKVGGCKDTFLKEFRQLLKTKGIDNWNSLSGTIWFNNPRMCATVVWYEFGSNLETIIISEIPKNLL